MPRISLADFARAGCSVEDIIVCKETTSGIQVDPSHALIRGDVQVYKRVEGQRFAPVFTAELLSYEPNGTLIVR
jgi:hypothetical protein